MEYFHLRNPWNPPSVGCLKGFAIPVPKIVGRSMASIKNTLEFENIHEQYIQYIYIYTYIYIYLKLDEDIWKTSWKLNTHIYIYIMGVAIYIYIYTSGQRLHSELENHHFYSRLIIYKWSHVPFRLC